MIGIVPANTLVDYVGQELGVSDWFQVDQDRIDQFADVTLDHQFIHIDSEKATPLFGSTIAHGFLVLSFASKFALDVLPPLKKKEVRINYGFNKIRFVHPVLVNSKIRGIFTLKNIEKKNNLSLISIYELTIEIQNNQKPAIVSDWIILKQFSD